MRLLISFAALFLSVILLQLSSGGVGPLDAISGLKPGFTTAQVGFLGSAHFFGFFIGCWWAPRLMGSIGHSRAFASTEERVELSAALMFFYATGAIASPLIASSLINAYGPISLFIFLAAGYGVLIIFSLSRMSVRRIRKRAPLMFTPRAHRS